MQPRDSNHSRDSYTICTNYSNFCENITIYDYNLASYRQLVCLKKTSPPDPSDQSSVRIPTHHPNKLV